MNNYGIFFHKKDGIDERKFIFDLIFKKIYIDYQIFSNYYIYYVENEDEIINIVKEKNLRGFNISNTFKTGIMNYCDELNSEAEILKNVDTVIVDDNKFIGYNNVSEAFEFMLYVLKLSLIDKSILIDINSQSAKSIAYSIAKKLNPKSILLIGKNDALKKETFNIIKEHTPQVNILSIDNAFGVLVDTIIVTSENDIFDKEKFIDINSFKVNTFINCCYLDGDSVFFDYIKNLKEVTNVNIYDSSYLSVALSCMSARTWEKLIAYDSYAFTVAKEMIIEKAKRS